MDLRVLLTTFALIFVAELGDKTQLAILSFTTESKSPLSVFLGSALALMLSSLLGVIFGTALMKIIPPQYIKTASGILFLIVGVWILFRK